MAVYNWSNTVTKWHYNPDNVRDPTVVYNLTSQPYGQASGYTGTQYSINPINFAPNVNTPTASVWTEIDLYTNFNIPTTCKEVILTGNSGITGTHMWTGVVYLWFRAPGSTWQLSPIYDGGYQGNICVHAPVALNSAGNAAIEMAWGTNGLDTTNWGTASTNPRVDNAWLNLILSGWGE